MVASKDAKGKPPAKPPGKGGKDEKSTDESVKLIIFHSKTFFLFTSNLYFYYFNIINENILIERKAALEEIVKRFEKLATGKFGNDKELGVTTLEKKGFIKNTYEKADLGRRGTDMFCRIRP